MVGRHDPVTCRDCGNVAIFSVHELTAHFRLMRWSDAWRAFAGLRPMMSEKER